MFWIWKLLGYTDKDVKYQKAIVGQYQLEKALEHFEKKEKEGVNLIKPLSQKQKHQQKSYADAVKKEKGGDVEV
tara:strand:- start:18563 stop:18784 length:222 start_codon:yes stop_codon:yes gene_type:complete